MKFPKKVNYSLFGVLIFINIIIRYIFLEHEIGVDSFQIHSYANSISGFGYATWIIHPYSYLGLTPDSYPSAVPFLLSTMSQCMNVEIEMSILLFSFMIGFIGIFGIILFAKEIKNDDLFIFFCAFLFSTSPIFLRFTLWTASTRSLFIGILPIFLWGLLKIRGNNELKWKYLGMTLILFIILLSTHRMGLLLFFYIIAFALTIIIFRSYKKIEFNTKIPKVAIVLWFTILFLLIYLQLQNVTIYREIGMGEGYQQGFFFKGQGPGVILANMVIDYGSRIGILSFIGIIGFASIFIKLKKPNSAYKSKRNFNELLIILILLFTSSVLFLGLYTSLVLLPIFIIIVSIGVLWGLNFINKFKGRSFSTNKSLISVLIILFLLIISTYFSYFMNQHWLKPDENTEESKWITDETIDSAFFIDEYNNNSEFLSNSGLLKTRISAWQSKPVDYRIDLESTKLQKGGILDLIRSDTLYVKKGGETKILYIPTKNCTDQTSINYLKKENIRLIHERKSFSGKTILYGHSGLTDSLFLQNLPEKRYRIYENNLETVWYVY
ncbi:MAG: hypothetical protein ACXAAH_15830 [Promethearchaeota archaeon]|jgi:hypothetical protein